MKRGHKIGIVAIVFLALLMTPVALQLLEKTNSQTMFLNDTLEFDSTTKYALTPIVKGEIKSIKITGKVLGEGQAKVLLGDKIIFDSYLENQETITITGDVITGFVVNDSNSTETNETTVNETETNSTNTTEVNVTETNSTATNVTETNSTNTTEVNVTEVEEIIVIETPPVQASSGGGGSSEPTFDESIEKEFTKECTDTCKLKDIIFSEEYVLEIIVENSKLIIYEIEYEIVPIK